MLKLLNMLPFEIQKFQTVYSYLSILFYLRDIIAAINYLLKQFNSYVSNKIGSEVFKSLIYSGIQLFSSLWN